MVNYFYQDISFELDNENSITNYLTQLSIHYNFNLYELNYIFTNDDNILEVNKTYLKHDYYTDIITFNYNNKRNLKGDIYISIDTVQSNAESHKTGFKMELLRVIFHGFLHLVGFNDKTDDEQLEMTKQEDFCLSKVSH